MYPRGSRTPSPINRGGGFQPIRRSMPDGLSPQPTSRPFQSPNHNALTPNTTPPRPMYHPMASAKPIQLPTDSSAHIHHGEDNRFSDISRPHSLSLTDPVMQPAPTTPTAPQPTAYSPQRPVAPPPPPMFDFSSYGTPHPAPQPAPIQQQPSSQQYPQQPQKISAQQTTVQSSVPSYGQPTQAPQTTMPPEFDPLTQMPAPPVDTSSTKPADSKVVSSLKAFGSILGLVAIVIGGATLLNAFVFQSYYVDGLSMSPTLADNDRLIVSKVERTTSHIESGEYIPERGQIIVVDSGVSVFTQERNEQIIKRVIGIPGDTVSINNGVVTVRNEIYPNGINIDKELGLQLEPTFSDLSVQVKVPDGEVFVLGDNRTEGGSFDSRAFGTVKQELILGRLWVRVLPFNEVRVF